MSELWGFEPEPNKKPKSKKGTMYMQELFQDLIQSGKV
jgi:hypothetical protein